MDAPIAFRSTVLSSNSTERRDGKRIVFPRAVELDGDGRQITETFLLENLCRGRRSTAEKKDHH